MVSDDPRPCLHFVGFRDDRWWNAIKVFGRPDFVHPRWDQRARREIAEGDTIIFATGDEPQPVAKFTASDFIEPINERGSDEGIL